MLRWFLYAFLFIAGNFLINSYEVYDENRYKILWSANEDIKHDSSIFMRTSHGETYNCVVPVENEKSDDGIQSHVNNTGEFLERLMKIRPCNTRLENYWSYELCHNNYVRQFHEQLSPDKTSLVQEYYLGYFDKDQESLNESPSAKPPEIMIGETSYPYYKISYSNGTPCDLTNINRSTSVLYICHEGTDGGIVQVSEVESCKYEVVFATRYLCANPAYTLPKRSVMPISCIARPGVPPKPSALIELENEKSKLSQLGISNLASLLGDTFRHVQIEAEKSPTGIIYRIRAVNIDPDQDSSEDVQENQSETSMSDDVNTEERTSTHHMKDSNEFSRSAVTSQVFAFLRGEFCLVGRTAGWWMHEICFRKNVTQFHTDEDGKRVHRILLGEWDREVHDEWASKQPGPNILSKENVLQRSHDLFYGNGDFCHSIDDKRHAIVKIRCDKSANGIYLSFAEQYECEYSVLVESSIFCDMSDEDWQNLIL